MPKAIVVYCTKMGNTGSIAEFVAEGLRFGGLQATLKTVNEISDPAELEGYDAVALGSPTYGTKMMEEMASFLEKLKSLNLEGKKGGAFGAFGWSGEAPDAVYEVMKKELKMDMVTDSLRLKAAEVQGGMQMAQQYGKSIALKVS